MIIALLAILSTTLVYVWYGYELYGNIKSQMHTELYGSELYGMNSFTAHSIMVRNYQEWTITAKNK